MNDCPYIIKCPFFNDQLKNIPQLANSAKIIYCKDNYTACCRYKVADKLGRTCRQICSLPILTASTKF